MQFKKFQEVLKEKYPTSSAYIPNIYGTNDRQLAIEVTFNEGQKSYTYKGTIYSIAQRLNLIPEVVIMDEAEKVAKLLKTQNEVIAPSGCRDTVAWLLQDADFGGKIVDETGCGKDEFDRPQAKYSLVENSGW